MAYPALFGKKVKTENPFVAAVQAVDQATPKQGSTLGTPVKTLEPTMLSAPKGQEMQVNSAPTFAPNPAKLNPVAPQIPQQSKEWDILKKQAASRLSIADSEADRTQAMAMQGATESAIAGGLDTGDRAYAAMQNRAIDTSSQNRMGLLNTASEQNLADELGQTRADVAEEKQMSNEAYQAEMAAIEQILNNPNSSPEMKQEAAYARDAANAKRYGTSLGAGDTGSFLTNSGERYKESQENPFDSETAALGKMVERAISSGVSQMSPEETTTAAENANAMGLATQAEINKWAATGLLQQPGFGALYSKQDAAKGNPKVLSAQEWKTVASSDELTKLFLDHPVHEPGMIYKVGDTLIEGSGEPSIVVKNPQGEGLYAQSLVDPTKFFYIKEGNLIRSGSSLDAISGKKAAKKSAEKGIDTIYKYSPLSW